LSKVLEYPQAEGARDRKDMVNNVALDRFVVHPGLVCREKIVETVREIAGNPSEMKNSV